MAQPPWDVVEAVDDYEINLATWFGDTAGASTFQRYRDLARQMQHPEWRRGEHMGFNAWPDPAGAALIHAAGGRWMRFAYEGQWGSWRTKIAELTKIVHDGGLKSLTQVMGFPGANTRRFPVSDAERATYADYALFCADQGADLLELWNEQNGKMFTNGGNDPKLYALMVIAAYERIKKVHPNLPVITGGTTPFAPPTDPITWDRSCKAASVHYADHRDGLAGHPYDWSGRSPLVDPIAWNAFAQMATVHADNPGVDVYITEVGSPSGPSTTHTSSGEFYTADRQARWLDLYNAGMDAWPFTPKLVIWHTLYDGGKGVGYAQEPYFGHFTAAGADKIDSITGVNVSNRWRKRAGEYLVPR